MRYQAKRIELRLWDETNPVLIDVEGVPETQEEWEQFRGVALRTCTIDEAGELGVDVAEEIVAFGESMLEEADDEEE